MAQTVIETDTMGTAASVEASRRARIGARPVLKGERVLQKALDGHDCLGVAQAQIDKMTRRKDETY